jgi:NAD(P)-dependent dehydrogenase (short-subunit alcohol dehydrogenase family)
MLNGKVAIITGSGRGIGRAMAEAMAKSGARVIVNDPGMAQSGEGEDKGPAEEVVDAIKAAGGEAAPNFDSVVSFEGTTNMVNQALETYGRLDIVVNNAGVLRDRMLHKMSPEDWQLVQDVHLGGHFNMCRAAINVFREQQSGRVINFTSTSGLIGNLGQTNYGSAKLGIMAFTHILAMESKPKNITVNVIAPFAWTRMTASIPVTDEASQARVDNIKKMKPEFIANLVIYLCSDAAGEITGQTFGVRAGEIILFGPPQPLRSVHHAQGWTPEEIGEKAMGALSPFFTPPRVSADLFPYEPMD